MMSRIVTADRCSQLNGMRLRGEFVDVVFVVEGQSFPAHKAIVSLHSPVLRMLVWGSSGVQPTDMPVPFYDCHQRQIVLSVISQHTFADFLAYFYLGRIKITEENVVSILRAKCFLQIEDKRLLKECLALLYQILNRKDGCPVGVFFEIWTLAEDHSLTDLKRQIFVHLSWNFEALINEGLLEQIGCEEMRSILALDDFCARSEKLLFDTFVSWFDRWTTNELNDVEKYSVEIFKLLCLNQLNENYVKSQLSKIIPDVTFEHITNRTCKKCSFISFGTRLDEKIFGLPEHAEERKNQLYLLKLRPSTEEEKLKDNDISYRWEEMEQMGSFHDLLRPTTLIATPSELIAFKSENYIHKFQVSSMFSLSFDNFSCQEKQFNLPDLYAFTNVVLVNKTIYLIGGIKETLVQKSMQPSLNTYSVPVKSFKKAIVEKVQIHWEQLADLPSSLLDFSLSLVAIDNHKVFSLSRSFCFIYDISGNKWSNVPVPFECSLKADYWRPAVTSLGTTIYSFHNASVGGWKFDTFTLKWTNFPCPEYEDPISAFSHNGYVFLIATCQSKTKLFSYNLQTDLWTIETTSKCGNIVQGGVLLTDDSNH